MTEERKIHYIDVGDLSLEEAYKLLGKEHVYYQIRKTNTRMLYFTIALFAITALTIISIIFIK